MNKNLENIQAINTALENIKSQLDLKSELDHAYINGKIDGWKEAIDYVQKLVSGYLVSDLSAETGEVKDEK